MSDINQEVEEVLDNPLVVHKKSDASYKDGTAIIEMNETHDEEDGPTLQRHRFRKDPNKKKKKKGLLVIPFLLVIVAAVFCALYFTGNIQFGPQETTKKTTEKTTEATTSLQEAYKGTIVIKNTFIFVNGEEVDGIEGLESALKYEDPSETAYKIILEKPNGDFLNRNVLEILSRLKFYGKSTIVEHVSKTGLEAAAETTTVELTTETTTQITTTNAATTQSQTN